MRKTTPNRIAAAVGAFAVWSLFPAFLGAFPQDSDRLGLRMLVVESEAEALELRRELDAGETFERLARIHSLDPSGGGGGYLGAFATRDLRPEFREALDRVRPGAVSAVSRIDGAYTLFKLLTEDETRWMEMREAGFLGFQRGRYDQALESYEAALAIAETFGPGDYRLGESLKDLAAVLHLGERYAEAVSLYERSLPIEWALPDSEAALTPLLEALNDLVSFAFFPGERFLRMRAEFEAALADTRLKQDVYLAMARMLLLAELPADSETVLRRAVEVFPESRDTHYELGEYYASAGRHLDALSQFEMARAADADGFADPAFFGLVSTRIGDSLDNLNRFDEALSAYGAALEQDPQNIALLLARAVVYLHRGDFEDGLRELEDAESRAPANPSVYSGQADLYLRSGRFAEAVEAGERALELDATLYETRYIVARALNRMGRREEGQVQMLEYQEAQSGAESSGGGVREVSERAAALVLEGRETEAFRSLEELIDAYPDSPIPWLTAGMAERWLGRHQEAVERLQAMVDLGMGDSMVHRGLAVEHEALGDTRTRDQHQAMFLQIIDATLTQLADEVRRR